MAARMFMLPADTNPADLIVNEQGVPVVLGDEGVTEGIEVGMVDIVFTGEEPE